MGLSVAGFQNASAPPIADSGSTPRRIPATLRRATPLSPRRHSPPPPAGLRPARARDRRPSRQNASAQECPNRRSPPASPSRPGGPRCPTPPPARSLEPFPAQRSRTRCWHGTPPGAPQGRQRVRLPRARRFDNFIDERSFYESELAERGACTQTFAREMVVMPGNARPHTRAGGLPHRSHRRRGAGAQRPGSVFGQKWWATLESNQ